MRVPAESLLTRVPFVNISFHRFDEREKVASRPMPGDVHAAEPFFFFSLFLSVLLLSSLCRPATPRSSRAQSLRTNAGRQSVIIITIIMIMINNISINIQKPRDTENRRASLLSVSRCLEVLRGSPFAVAASTSFPPLLLPSFVVKAALVSTLRS